MKKIINILSILFLLTLHGFAQKDFDINFEDEILKKVKNKSSLNSTLLYGPNQLETIEIIANSSGAITPQFVYKGDVDPDAVDLIVDPTAFTGQVGGSSLSSISPDDNGQFFISQRPGTEIYSMIEYIHYAKSPMYELRFEADDAGLALDGGATWSIYKVPFTVWDINGTPGFPNDDRQMFTMTWSSTNADSSWGIRNGHPSGWSLNPAQSSDNIYIYSFKDGIAYADFEAAYQTQVSTGIINPNLLNDFLENYVLRRITINSLDANPLTTINSINGLPRPAPGTVIRWSLFIDLFFIEESMYEVVGEPSYNKPFFTGWPPPTVSTIQLPAWMNYNVNGELTGTPGIADSGWNNIGLQATNTQGTVEGWYDMWVDLFPWIWWDHNNNNIITTVFNVGKMGTMFQDIGAGFQFYGPNGFQNGLYDGELIIAKSDSQLSGGLHSDILYHDFATKKGITTIYSPLAGFDQAFRTEYDDSRNYSPLGVKVIQQSYTKSTAPDDDYIILDYEIFNENSTTLSGIYVGLQTDWDVGDYSLNLGGFDTARKLNYVFEEGGANNPCYYGVAILNKEVSGNTFNTSFDDSILFTQMISFEPPPTITGEDRRSMVATGPFDIAPNEAIRVVFAVLGGTDLADIQTNADAALNVNLNRRPALSNPQDGASEIELNPILYWNPVLDATSYEVQVDDDPNFSPPLVWSLSGVTNSSEQVFGLSEGNTYYWRVNATHPDGTSDWSEVWSFNTFSYPQTIDLASPSIQFPTHNDISNYVPQDYRIVGIPGRIDTDMNIDAILGGVHKSDWQTYRDNGTNSQNPDDYLVEFDGSGEFIFGNGRAFWVIKKGTLNINKSGVETAILNSNGEAEIQLHAGWNLITNPFNNPLPWWQVHQSNSDLLDRPIYSFNGGWNDSDNNFSDFEPYMGYYVDSPGNMILKIPFGATLSKPLSLKKHIWQLDIVLSMNEIKKSLTKLGISEQADYERDNLDYRKPRSVGAIPSVYFYRPEWDGGYGIFATDIRPQIQDIEKWDFTVSGSLNQKTTISFSEIEDIPEKHEIYLLDEIHSVYVNLRDQSEYSFIPVTEISNFVILVGNREAMNDELDNIIPTEFELGKNFPNPFNPSTIIPVSIPKESEITLKVYNVLGQEVRTIFNGTKESGKHYFRWDGTNYLNQQVAAGVYLYRLTVKGNNVFVGKMVLVK